MDALDWKPRPFTEEELADIDPVIRAYMKDVDQTMVVASLRLTPAERVATLESQNRFLAELRAAGKKASGDYSIRKDR